MNIAAGDLLKERIRKARAKFAAIGIWLLFFLPKVKKL
jgi:hypothetical protein